MTTAHEALNADNRLAAGSTWMSSMHKDVAVAPPVESTEKVEVIAPRKKQRRGFAAMSAEKQKLIASLGGKAAHAKGTAHEFSPAEAREAGRKGGQAAQRVRSDATTKKG